MSIAIISSTKDIASANIKGSLLDNFNFKEAEEKYGNNQVYHNTIGNEKIKIFSSIKSISYCLYNEKIKIYTIDSDLIHKENIDKEIDADLFLFISKHRAQEERKSLTVHPIGNFGKAEFGGKENSLCFCPTLYFKAILDELAKNSANSGYDVTVEATHHGPYLEKPALFIEIGSTEKEWEDKEAGKIVARAIINSIKEGNTLLNQNNTKINSAFIIGGGHYSHAANKLMLKDGFAAGHICGKYNLENLDALLIKEAMEKTVPKASFVLLDWKGLGKEKRRIVTVLEKNVITYQRSNTLF